MTERAFSWIFAYASLMWKPGFIVDISQPGRLIGYHRSLCVFSHHHRGTPARPGLVMGLDRGGACEGVLIGVVSEREPQVLAYLDERELVTNVYERRKLPVVLTQSSEQRTVDAWCYVVRQDHDQYAGSLPTAETCKLVRQGHGLAGACVDYVLNTLAHLRELGIEEAHLEGLAADLEREDRRQPLRSSSPRDP